MTTYDVKTVTSVLKMVDINEVKNNRQAILESDFQMEERNTLAGRHVRSTAGILALKHALCTLLHQITGLSIDKKDWQIAWSATGRPEIHSSPSRLNSSSFLQQNLFLSISHSRKTAYGLAVYQESTNE